MKMKKKTSLTLLITFVLICLISVNAFASYGESITAVQEPQQNQSIQTFGEPVPNTYVQPRTDNQSVQPQPNTTGITSSNEEVKGDAALPTKQKTELLNLKEQSRTSLEKYKAKYKNNALYGVIAYSLNIARLASVPFFVIGILISVVYEYIVGMKRREMVRKGKGLRITIGSAFVMAQVLPLIFAIVIKFWGN